MEKMRALRHSVEVLVPLFLLQSMFLNGCGNYSFTGAVPKDIKNIAIPLFANQTAEFGIQETITDALVAGFQREGILKIVDETRADAILHGTILRIDDTPNTYSASEQVSEYRFQIACEIILENARTGESLWKQTFTTWGNYPYTGSLADRQTGINEALRKLTEDILNRIVSNW
ncbi:MAG: LptE family protein [bacterium]